MRGVAGSTPMGYDKSAAWRARNPERATAIRKSSQRKWYLNNKKHVAKAAAEWAANNSAKRSAIISRHSKKALETISARRRRNKSKAIAYMGGYCADCKQVFHSAAMDFHHLDGSTKGDNVSTMLTRATWEKTLVELNKCVLLCANCHRTRHANAQ